jgi:HlyD family secretion protein
MDLSPRNRRSRSSRPAFAYRGMLAVLVLVVAIPVLAWKFVPSLSRSNEADLPMLYVVQQGNFSHDIIERGAVESASNIEIRCEVQAQNTAGTRILLIIPEGTYVKKGDLICRLDSSALDNDRLKQTSVVENANAAKIQAESDHETAIKALSEYEEGKYKIDEATILGELAVAQEDQRRAADVVRYSTQLLERGYITKLQLEADEFAAKKAKTNYEAATLKKKVLETYTKEKTRVQLNADIKSTEAKLKAQVNTWQLEDQRLKLIVQQIEKCTICATENGQVVYANNTERMGGQEIIIEEGALLRERQVIVRLPDPKRMQVKAKINESKIALAKENQPAVIRLDALPDQELSGIVRKVNEYPVQNGWWSANIKEYETTVEILGSPPGLRPGLNAEVRIRVTELPNVVQIPVQSLFEHGDKHYCFVRKNDDWELREVEVGDTNDKTIVVKNNLKPGESLALNAAALRENYELPPLPVEPQSKVMLASTVVAAPAAGEPAKKASAKPGDLAESRPAGPPKPAAEKKPVEPPKAPAGAPVALAGLSFQKLDKDGDGRITASDLPESLRGQFASIDANHDGYVDRKEWTAAVQRLASASRNFKPRTGGG